MEKKVECARCQKRVCLSEHGLEGPENCPTRNQAAVIKESLAEYDRPDIREFARQASVQEFEGYMNLPEGRTPRNPRVEEVAQFAAKMGYRKLGVAFCVGLANEAGILTEILENRGFAVASVCCKCGAVAKETIGIAAEQKIKGPDAWETMCNPIAQAAVLKDAETQFNIAVGLCVGHDSLFFQYSSVPVTVLIAKDRVFGHNPAAGLYQAHAYYRKLLRKEKR